MTTFYFYKTKTTNTTLALLEATTGHEFLGSAEGSSPGIAFAELLRSRVNYNVTSIQVTPTEDDGMWIIDYKTS